MARSCISRRAQSFGTDQTPAGMCRSFGSRGSDCSGGRGPGETLGWQGTRQDWLVQNKGCMQSQARVSLSKRTLFHGVTLLKRSETGVQAPVGLPASLWETDSLDGEAFPFRAALVLTKCVFSTGWDSGETLLSGSRNLPLGPKQPAVLTLSPSTVG